MAHLKSIPARKLQKVSKAIIQGVKSNRQTTLGILQLAQESKEALKDLPENLRERADDVLYSK